MKKYRLKQQFNVAADHTEVRYTEVEFPTTWTIDEIWQAIGEADTFANQRLDQRFGGDHSNFGQTTAITELDQNIH